MVRLVDDLLDVSRVTAGKIELRKDLVDVGVIVQQAVQTSQPMMAEKQHELRVALPPDPLELIVDPARLAQIVCNLLSNAAKYTDNGGRIELSAAPVGELVELRVRDNGRGIRSEMLPQVFGLFVQSDRTLDMAQGGLGVGLTLVKRLVELHGGTITARSAGEGAGSEFIVRLPGVSRRQAERYVPPPRRDVTGEFRAPSPVLPDGEELEPARHLRILVVDDNADIRATLRDLLEMQGHRVEVAEDGPQAFERVLATRPDVAIVDIGLPGMDGFSLARALRQDPKMRTRLVAMTGYGQAEDRRRALDAGFEAHVVKPVELDDLLRLLQEQP